MSAHRLLVVDDAIEICNLVQDIGESCGYVVNAVTSPESFTNAFSSFNPTFTILDLNFSDNQQDGIQLLRFLANKECRCPIVILSGFDEKLLNTAFKLGSAQGLDMIGSLKKPISIQQLTEILEKAKYSQKNLSLDQLVQGIEENQFVIHYQPKILLRTGEIVATEALVRWQPLPETIIYPDFFIPLAEKNNLIRRLTSLILDKVFAQYKQWGIQKHGLAISINISPTTLDVKLPEEILELTKTYQVDPQNVVLEITETALMKKPHVAMETLTRLRINGFKLAIDDFGIGYSSLAELYRLPFNELKIDKAFIKNLDQDNDAYIITNSIIQLAHNLNMKVTAEGVESKEVVKHLKELNCDFAQGYIFSYPLNADEFIKLFLNSLKV